MTLIRRARTTVDAGPIVASVLAVSAGFGTLWVRLDFPQWPCLFREATGWPCLTCGATRLFEALLAGDVIGAAAWNPLVFAALFGTTLWAAASTGGWLLGYGSWSLSMSPREWLAARLAIVPIAGANWTYLIWSGV